MVPNRKPKATTKQNGQTIVVRISRKTLERLKPFAIPLKSSVDDAIKAVLDIVENRTIR